MNLKRLLGIGARKAARLAADDSLRKQFARLEAENELLREQVAYWKGKAESLLDAALAKAGHTPVMKHEPLTPQAAAMLQPYAGLAVQTINPAPSTPREAAKS